MRNSSAKRESVRALPYYFLMRSKRLFKIFPALLSLAASTSLAQTKVVVTVPVANMYSSAREDVDVVSQAIYGSTVEVSEESAGWAKVETNDQYTGWMRLEDTHAIDAPGYATSGKLAQVS